jgi:hypothetical protein
MINFTKKLRKGSSSNYLSYAIGEIFLVVFGILIALSINNWNEDRKKAKEENFYFSQLLEDTLADSVFYQSRQEGLKGSILAYNALSRASEGAALDTTISFERLFTIYAYESQLVQNHPDAVDLISDGEIQRTLLRYSNKYEYLKTGISLYNRLVEDHYLPFQIEHHQMLGFNDNQRLLANYQYLFDKTNFGGIIHLLERFSENAIQQVDSMIIVNQELINQLNQKLE